MEIKPNIVEAAIFAKIFLENMIPQMEEIEILAIDARIAAFQLTVKCYEQRIFNYEALMRSSVPLKDFVKKIETKRELSFEEIIKIGKKEQENSKELLKLYNHMIEVTQKEKEQKLKSSKKFKESLERS